MIDVPRRHLSSSSLRPSRRPPSPSLSARPRSRRDAVDASLQTSAHGSHPACVALPCRAVLTPLPTTLGVPKMKEIGRVPFSLPLRPPRRAARELQDEHDGLGARSMGATLLAPSTRVEERLPPRPLGVYAPALSAPGTSPILAATDDQRC